MTEKKSLKNIVETLERRVNDIREDFNDLKAEMTRRFGPKKDDEICRSRRPSTCRFRPSS